VDQKGLNHTAADAHVIVGVNAMAKKTSKKSRNRELGDSKTASTKMIRFSATLLRPRLTTASLRNGGQASATANPRPRKVAPGSSRMWTFLTLPKQASAKLPSRSRVSVEGTLNGLAFRATLEPDGQGGHWLKLDRKLRESLGGSGAELPGAGGVVTLEITPVAADKEPEPKVPADLRKALAIAPQKARDVWSDITPIARRDWIHWIVSAKQAQTRARRIRNACSMLAAGKRRPCCFDRSGMYDKSLSCPVAADDSSGAR
jgi:hypothetical protein